MVQRDVQRRQSSQFNLPVGTMFIESRLLHAIVLPNCVVCELKRQFGDRWRAVLREGGVMSAKFIAENSNRPAVRNDVVHGGKQHVLLVTKLQKASANQRPILQIKSTFAFLNRHAFLFRISFSLC